MIASLGAGYRSRFRYKKGSIIKLMIMILSVPFFVHQNCERQRDQFTQTDLWGECSMYHTPCSRYMYTYFSQVFLISTTLFNLNSIFFYLMQKTMMEHIETKI